MASRGAACVILLGAILLVGCSPFQPQPGGTPTPTLPPSATLTRVPTLASTLTLPPGATITPKPTRTSLPPTLTPNVYGIILPVGQPVAEWNGIPVMPFAIAGEESTGRYAYTVKSTVLAVREFYTVKMPGLGWTLLGSGLGDTGTIGNILDIYTRENQTLSIGIVLADQAEGLVLVLLVL